MALFSGLSTPSWESPDDFLNSSQARGDKLASNFLEGYRQAHQEALQAPMNAMKLQAAQAEHEGQLLDIAKQKNWMDTQQEMKAGESVLSSKVAEIAKSGSWNDPVARSAIFDTVAKYPATANSPMLKETMGWMQASDKATEAAKHQQDLADVQRERIEVLKERNDALAESATEQNRIRQQNADANTTRATTASLLAEWKKDSSVDNEPQTTELPDGSTLAWRPKGSSLHVIKGASAKEVSPAIALQVAKELSDKNPAKVVIMNMLTSKATNAPAATVAAPASKAEMGGYKIGTTYKGGLKYLGGDPNDQNNWQKAQ